MSSQFLSILTVRTRHGTITGFKVYRGLQKLRFQNHKNFSLYRSCGMCSFLRVVKDPPSPPPAPGFKDNAWAYF